MENQLLSKPSLESRLCVSKMNLSVTSQSSLVMLMPRFTAATMKNALGQYATFLEDLQK